MIMPVNSRRLLIIVSVVCLAGPAWTAEERFVAVPSADRVSIRSDEAWEGTEPDVIHFSGRFRLEARDWFLSADQATLYGNLDDPETVILSGSPARFRITAEAGGRAEVAEGDAARITYLRRDNLIRLENQARLVWGDSAIRGDRIEYDFDADRFSAGGDEGIRIVIPPLK